jgi:3-oxoacyl-[acyl-carrier protein] reductase
VGDAAGERSGLLGLVGRRVLVTGGSRGIGAACCRLFARAGAAVAVAYRAERETAEALAASLPESPGGPHVALQADLSHPPEIEALFARLAEIWGGLDVLVNNAGIWEGNPIRELDAARHEALLALNVTGPFLCARAALLLMEGAADPSIVNVASTAGQRGEAFHSSYAASKGALISATKSWAVELAPRVRVNCVAPGWVETPMTEEALAGPGRAEVVAAIPLGRVASADDVAGPIVFLASPLARHVTGEILNVNGGSVLVG